MGNSTCPNIDRMTVSFLKCKSCNRLYACVRTAEQHVVNEQLHHAADFEVVTFSGLDNPP